MLRSIFLKSLRDQRRSLFWWGVGLAALSLLTVLFYPAIGAAPELGQALEQAPEALRVLLGEWEDLTSPEGYLNSQLFFFAAPLLFIIFAVVAGSGAIAGEEERGTLELLLANPLPRWQLVVEKFLGMVVGTFVAVAAFWLGLVAGALAIDMEIGMGRMAEASLSGALLALVFGGLALAVGCARGRRGPSVGSAAALAVAAYFLNALAPIAEGLEPFRVLSPFYYYIGADPLSHGLNPAHAATLAALTLALLAVALLTFARRDIGT